MNWYVLFIKVGQEQKVEYLLNKRLDTNTFTPFVPMQQILLKIHGSLKKELKPLFPGYVFIKTKVSDREFITNVSTVVYDSQYIIRILRYSETEIAMRQNEKNILLSLCNDNHFIEVSSAIKEGNVVHIIDGPLKGMESIVRKVNRHKRQAWIEIEFMGDVKLVRVGLEIVEKKEEVFEF